MEREGHHAAAAAAIPCQRWAEDVIVLSSGRPPWPPSAEGAHHYPDPPPDKLYYKTKLCDKYETSGCCSYEQGCTFAHGRAELRPPVPHHAAGGGVWRRNGADNDHQRGGGGYGGRVCHNFRDKGYCHFGDNCAFPHHAPPGRGPGEQKTVVEPRRTATPPPVRTATGPRYAGAPGPGRAFPPVPAAAARDRLRQIPEEESSSGARKPTVLELLSLRKTNGIYGDWPEQYQN